MPAKPLTIPNPDTVAFIADRGDARDRLDRAIVRRVHDVSSLSRARVQHWIADGRVLIDEVVTRRPATRPREGATIRILLPSTAARRVAPEPEPGQLAILYEDQELLVLDKPAGVVVHPSYRNSSGTLLNVVLGHLRGRGITTSPGIVTRLDKDTSGLVVIATAPRGHHTLQQDGAQGRLDKLYLAVVAGIPPERGAITLPLDRDPADRRRMVATPAGMRAETRYVRLASADGCSLVRCELVTGRTHQIRVHLAASGFPLLGDPLYGTPHPALDRQALHAWRVRGLHPTTRDPFEAEAPPPADLRAAFPALFAAWRGDGRDTPLPG